MPLAPSIWVKAASFIRRLKLHTDHAAATMAASGASTQNRTGSSGTHSPIITTHGLLLLITGSKTTFPTHRQAKIGGACQYLRRCRTALRFQRLVHLCRNGRGQRPAQN